MFESRIALLSPPPPLFVGFSLSFQNTMAHGTAAIRLHHTHAASAFGSGSFANGVSVAPSDSAHGLARPPSSPSPKKLFASLLLLCTMVCNSVRGFGLSDWARLGIILDLLCEKSPPGKYTQRVSLGRMPLLFVVHTYVSWNYINDVEVF